VRLTHGGMTARLDQVTSGAEDEEIAAPPQSSGRASPKRGRRKKGQGNNDDLDVPEFIPRG
jgi:hypothetical protein